MDIKNTDEEARRGAAAEIANHIVEVLFYFFEEQEENLENDEELDEFVQYLWNIAILSMASVNMKILGTGEGRKIFVEMTPESSVKKMLIENYIAEHDENYYEDLVEDIPDKDANVSFGQWEDVFIPPNN
jgi:hypothetical protein